MKIFIILAIVAIGVRGQATQKENQSGTVIEDATSAEEREHEEYAPTTNSEQPEDITEDKKREERIAARGELETTANDLKNRFNDKTKFVGTNTYEAIVAFEKAGIDAINWLDENPDAELEDLIEQSEKLLNTVQTAASKVSESSATKQPIDEATESESTSTDKRTKARNDLEKAAYGLKSQLRDKTKFIGTPSYENIVAMENAALDAIKWLDENEDAGYSDFIQQGEKLKNTITTLVSEINQSTAATPPINVSKDETEATVSDIATESESTSGSEDAEERIKTQSKKLVDTMEKLKTKIIQSATAEPPINVSKDETEPSVGEAEPENKSEQEEPESEADAAPAPTNSKQPEDVNEEKKRKDRIAARRELESAVYGIKNEFKDKAKFSGTLAYENVEAMENAANDALKWLDENENADIEDYQEQKKKLLNTVQILMSKLLQSAAATDEAELGETKSESTSDSEEDRIAARDELTSAAYGLKIEFSDTTKFAGTIAYESINAMGNVATDVIKWLEENQDADIEEYAEQKRKLLTTVETLMSSIIQSAAATPPINESTDEVKPAVDDVASEKESTSDSGDTDKRIKARNDLKKTAYGLKDQFSDKTKFAGTIAYENVEAMENAAIDVIKWLDQNEDAGYDQYVEQSRKLLNTMETLMSKLIQSSSATPPINVSKGEAEAADDVASERESTSDSGDVDKRIKARNDLEKTANALRNQFSDKTKFVGTIAYENVEAMENAAIDVIKWLDQNEDADYDQYVEKSEKLVNTITNLVSKLLPSAAATPPNVPKDETESDVGDAESEEDEDEDEEDDEDEDEDEDEEDEDEVDEDEEYEEGEQDEDEVDEDEVDERENITQPPAPTRVDGELRDEL